MRCRMICEFVLVVMVMVMVMISVCNGPDS